MTADESPKVQAFDRWDRTPLTRRAFMVSLVSVVAAACNFEDPTVSGPPQTPSTTSTPTALPPTPTTPPLATAETTLPPTLAPEPPQVPPEPTPTPQLGVSTQQFATTPFTLGVASGDPLATSVILWTRFAPDPQAEVPETGATAGISGGMFADPIFVNWEIATDQAFTDVIQSGGTDALPQHGHSVHVDAQDLEPDTWYWYRFLGGGFASPIGRTRTLPAEDTSPEQLRYAFSSCQQREVGYYAAHRALAEAGDDIDLFFWLGDYIYEYGPSVGAPLPERAHGSPEVETLAGYRNRYAQYRSDQHLQLHHATRPWIVTWDDHEVDNDHAGDISENRDATDAFRGRRAAAYQAWWEHMPVRLPAPMDQDLAVSPYRIHRSTTWGDLAEFWVLDGRQYRADQPSDGEFVAFPGVFEDPSVPLRTLAAQANDPGRTMLGEEQQQWLIDGVGSSDAVWQVVPQQTLMCGLQVNPVAPAPMVTTDTWDGYHGNRTELLTALSETNPNLIVLSGDFHMATAADLEIDPHEPSGSPVVGAEFMSGAISSRFGLEVDPDTLNLGLVFNPQIKYIDTANGYVVCDAGRDMTTATFFAVQDTLDPESAVTAVSSWQVEAGSPGVSAAGG